MLLSPLFKRAFALLSFIAVLDILGEIFYLDWTLWWFATLLHLLGGFCVAMAFLSFWLQVKKKPVSQVHFVLSVFLPVLCVGILWEIFELYLGLASFSESTSRMLGRSATTIGMFDAM